MNIKQPILLGHHINTSHGFDTCAYYANKTGAAMYQIFLKPPQSFKPSKITDIQLKRLKHNNERLGKRVVVHGSYLINLC